MKKNYLKKSDSDEENEKSDRYLITYADLITLLLGLFVILYSSSQIDSTKYKEMSEAFMTAFGTAPKGDGILPGSKGAIVHSNVEITKSINKMEEKAKNILDDFLRTNKLFLQNSGNSLIITLPESLFFASSKADINSQGMELLDSISSLLANSKFQISVDGHTDSNPIRTFRYESNWHLSSDRALKIAYALISRGLAEENVVVRAFASQRPIADNTNEEGRSQNRRVEITLTEISNEAPSKNGYEQND